MVLFTYLLENTYSSYRIFWENVTVNHIKVYNYEYYFYISIWNRSLIKKSVQINSTIRIARFIYPEHVFPGDYSFIWIFKATQDREEKVFRLLSYYIYSIYRLVLKRETVNNPVQILRQISGIPIFLTWKTKKRLIKKFKKRNFHLDFLIESWRTFNSI